MNEEFEKKQMEGENDNYICKLIRTDSIEDFIQYLNEKSILPNSKVYESIFETNPYLLKNGSTLIEYAVFHGSIQIFNYLRHNKVDIKPSLWIYAIHGGNPEIIQFLEENQIQPPQNSFDVCIKESIKCHHNDIANYFINNFMLTEKNDDKFDKTPTAYGIHFKNFEFIPSDLINDNLSFFYLCKYNYLKLVQLYLKNKVFDLDTQYVIFFFFLRIKFFSFFYIRFQI